MKKAYGFTIVELLIVIVVIGILAAISIVAYNNVSQKANNSAILDAAAKTQRMIQAYIAAEGKYPLPGPAVAFACVTTGTGCYSTTDPVSTNTTFNTSMGTIGQLPTTVPRSQDTRYGVFVTYWGGAGWGPFYMTYFLQGINQQCGLSPVLNSSLTGVASAGYTSGNSNNTGMTQCIIGMAGPPPTT